MTQSPCTLLEWDSAFFDKRIARCQDSKLSQTQYDTCADWCGSNNIDCLFLLADPNDQETLVTARDNGFLLTDIKLQFAASLDTENTKTGNVTVREATQEDVEALKQIAATSFTDSRFYYDGNFPAKTCDELYRTWVKNSIGGWAEQTLLTEDETGATGFITCHLDENAGRIGLIGVAERARGAGHGTALVKAACAWFRSQGKDTATVVTQGRNAGAQRLYQRCGFTTASIELWFHKWYGQSAS